jgi:hypothetical protein
MKRPIDPPSSPAVAGTPPAHNRSTSKKVPWCRKKQKAIEPEGNPVRRRPSLSDSHRINRNAIAAIVRCNTSAAPWITAIPNSPSSGFGPTRSGTSAASPSSDSPFKKELLQRKVPRMNKVCRSVPEPPADRLDAKALAAVVAVALATTEALVGGSSGATWTDTGVPRALRR